MSESFRRFTPLLQRLRRAVHPRPSSFSRRLTIGVVLVVVLTILLGALPPIIVINIQFHRQIKSRIHEAQLATHALFESERLRLQDMAQFVAERPTLCSLTPAGDRASLDPYLETLRQRTPADVLFLVTAGREPIASGRTLSLQPEAVRADRSLPFADFVVQPGPPHLVLAAAAAVPASGACAAAPSWVLVVQIIDDSEMKAIAQQTGVEQSIIVAGRRIATSLPADPGWPADASAAGLAQESAGSCCARFVFENEGYYTSTAPLTNRLNQPVAISETALPGNALWGAVLNSLILLIGASCITGLTCAVVLMTLINRSTRPLHSLLEATRRLSQGDLEQPIPTQSDWIEINLLADQLEVYRRHLQRLQLDNEREKKLVTRMLSATREGLIRLAPDGRITYINPDGESILGWPASRILNQHYDRFFRRAPESTGTLTDVLQPPPGYPPFKHLVILDANDNPLRLTITASWNEPGEAPDLPQARLLVFRKADEDLASKRLRSDFLANLAHEFRTPLSSITATIELLSEESPSMSPDEISELANTALLGAHHLHTLIDNVLESAVIEADCFRLRCSPVLLRDVLRNAVHIMAPLLKRRQQTLEIDQPKHFLTILADPNRLCQAVVNLLDNASKYSPFGSKIYLSFIKQEQNLLFSIQDSGQGIPPDRLNDLFRRFASLSEMQGANFGIGLGLPVVKTIIEAHGGWVGAENVPEGGARFWFTLPLRPAPNGRDHNDENPDCG